MNERRVTCRMGRELIGVMLGLALIVAGPPAGATVITFNDANAVQWQISFANQFNLQFQATVPAAANRTTIGKLTDATEHHDFSPEVITFTQIGQAPNEGAVTGGLRLLFETNTINATLTPWSAFKMTLMDLDLSQFAVLADKDHPPEAHFHSKNGATYSPFVAFIPPGGASGCSVAVAADVACNMLVTDGSTRSTHWGPWRSANCCCMSGNSALRTSPPRG